MGCGSVDDVAMAEGVTQGEEAAEVVIAARRQSMAKSDEDRGGGGDRRAALQFVEKVARGG